MPMEASRLGLWMHGCWRRCIPASRSNFSLPPIFDNNMISPVPIAPCFPFRKIRALVVVGRSLKVSGRPAPEFLKTSLRPSGMTSFDAGGGFGVGFGCGIDGDDQCRVPSGDAMQMG